MCHLHELLVLAMLDPICSSDDIDSFLEKNDGVFTPCNVMFSQRNKQNLFGTTYTEWDDLMF